MNTPLFVLGLIITIYLIYNLIEYFLLPKPPQRVGPEQIDLSTSTQVITSEELKKAWTGTSGSSLIFYINPSIKDRTSVSGNEYASVVKIGTKQSFKILIASDAGRGYSSSPAQFEIFVKSCSVPEVIEIPNFPMQRWTAVVIVRQGRKFSIYLNGKLTASHMCTAMPDFDDTQPLRVGDPRLSGQIALMSLAPYPMQLDEVRSTVEAAVDTNGKPYTSSGFFSFFLSIPSELINFNPMCPGGNCGSVQPAKTRPFEQWTSSYA